MPRFVFGLCLAVAVGSLASLAPAAAAAPSAVPSAVASAGAPGDGASRDAARDAGTIDGVVTSVDYTPGRSKMVVRSAGQTYELTVVAGTNVQGPSHDFAVDVKVGARVSVSASKSGTAYTAQIVRVLPPVAHAGH